MRPTWQEYYMSKAHLVSTRATCSRLSVGAVLVRENDDGSSVDLMTGYNGSLPGHPHCTDIGCLMHEGRCRRTIHAEMNILDRCSKFGISTDKAVMYVTHYPCPDCMMHLINAGIRRVYYETYYAHKFDNNLSKFIELIHLPKK